MKILITTDWYKPVVNGVVTSVINLAEGLTSRGHEVRILTLSNNILSRKEDNVYYIGSVTAGMIYPNARVLLPGGHKYMEELELWKPDIIHSQCEFSTFLMAKKISAVTGAPIVHTYHTVYEGYTHYFCPSKVYGRKMVMAFSRKIAEQTRAMIVPSGKIDDMLSGYGIQTPVHVIPSGIRIENFEKDNEFRRMRLRNHFGIGDNECVLIYIGRLAKEKNLEEIIEHLSDENCVKARLVIVGDGPYRSILEAKVMECHMEGRVIFAGMADPSAVADYYSIGDIFVSASTSETQGLTYMEAMASGLPLLCHEDACLRDVICDGTNGYTYQAREEFIAKLNVLYHQKDLRETFGAKARKLMEEKYSVLAFATACENLYENCIGQKDYVEAYVS